MHARTNVSIFVMAGSIFTTVVFLLAFYHAYSLERRKLISGFLGLAALFACFMSLANLLLGFLLYLADSALPMRTKPATRLRVGLAITLAVYLLALIPGAREFVKRVLARERYPVESLASRLEYEQAVLRDSTTAFAAANSADRSASGEVKKRLDPASPFQPWSSWRGRQLELLHRREVDAFVFATGFGIGRIFWVPPHIDEESLEYKEYPEPLTDQRGEQLSYLVIDGQTVRSTAPVVEDHATAGSAPKQEWLLGLHDEGAARFVSPESLGYVVSKQQAAGFVSHRFTTGQLPQLKADSPAGWTLARLELVSLLKHKEPRVYISEELPRMDKLKSVPTRELTEFEWLALSQLWHEKDIVVAEEGNEVLMLGALRARTECLDCHSVERGQLLGAFSYKIHPAARPAADSEAADLKTRIE